MNKLWAILDSKHCYPWFYSFWGNCLCLWSLQTAVGWTDICSVHSVLCSIRDFSSNTGNLSKDWYSLTRTNVEAFEDSDSSFQGTMLRKYVAPAAIAVAMHAEKRMKFGPRNTEIASEKSASRNTPIPSNDINRPANTSSLWIWDESRTFIAMRKTQNSLTTCCRSCNSIQMWPWLFLCWNLQILAIYGRWL